MTTPSTGPVRLTDEAVFPLATLDPAGPLDDLEWLDQAIGDSRVVAIGESAHYNRESYQLRHRLLRHLAERHGFTAYAMETGFTEGWLADRWVRGGEGDAGDPGRLGQVMADGLTSLMGLWTQLRTQLEWMRQHNRTAAFPVGFYGVDLSGSNVSLLPGLDAVIGYFAEADPGFSVDPGIRETASAWAASSAFSAPAALAAYAELASAAKDGLTAGLADLMAQMTARRADFLRRTTVDAYERALRSLTLTISIDVMVRELSRGNPHGALVNMRETAIADTVEWILRREGRVVLAAHNGHVQRCPVSMPGMPPSPTMGMHLADRLGKDYLVIGVTSSTGQTLNTDTDFYTGRLFAEMEPPQPGSLDALMAVTHDGPFATDLRRLSAADALTVQGVSQQRFGSFYSELSPVDAYDVIVHLPHVTPAEPDRAALAHAPGDVQAAFSRWKSS